MLRHTLGKEFESGAVLLVTSPAAGDGKTLTSVNLASCLAESGQPTLLIEADIRRPSVRQMLGSTIEPPGVEDVLARNVEPRHAVHGIQELNLYAAMVARVPDNPAQLIGGPGVKHFLAWARENFLWVVLDAPPVLPAADVSELLPFADAALLVIRAQSTPRELAKQAIDILGKHLRGVVFNEVTVDSNPHYRYLNNYYPPQKSDSKAGLIRNKLT
jgi:capsular exopolysaccharide synthesis family protein